MIETEISPQEMKVAVKRMPLAEARALAESCARVVGQFCSRVEIAGSIRRGRPICGDIDLVAMPKSDQAWLDLIQRVNVKLRMEAGGDENIVAIHREGGWQLDIFRAREGEKNLFGEQDPSNWGSLLVCRTGSKEHNIHLCNRAAERGLKWSPYRGVIKAGRIIASETEADIFKALGLSWLDPSKREI
jgi:DNA polymerase (family 10)